MLATLYVVLQRVYGAFTQLVHAARSYSCKSPVDRGAGRETGVSLSNAK
jgi:hypothetical protein